MKKDKRLLNDRVVQDAVYDVASKLNGKYSNLTEGASESVLVIALMNGSLVFAADLIRQLTFPIEFVTASLHGESERMIVSGKKGLVPQGRDVLIVDDIFDSGRTLDSCVKIIMSLKPKSIQCATLLKRDEKYLDEVRNPLEVISGYVIESRDFVYGYGLDDSQGLNRNLPEIYVESQNE